MKSSLGFTVIEMMIVTAIIGILAAIAIPAYQDYRRPHGNRDYQDSLPAGGKIICVQNQRVYQNADGQMATLRGYCLNN